MRNESKAVHVVNGCNRRWSVWLRLREQQQRAIREPNQLNACGKHAGDSAQNRNDAGDRPSGHRDEIDAGDAAQNRDDAGDRALVVAHRMHVRLATCSADLAERAESEGIDAVDLRRLMSELAPDHPPGERLVIDLVKSGRQPRQAVGYLPEGDMVVVNDASHLVGRDHVEVVVSSARQTTQGFLVFASLVEGGPSAVTKSQAVSV